MEDLRAILELWQKARAAGEDVCLVTLVRVEGSSYRKPGARMLLTQGGRRAGTVSGGCLEAEVEKKAWWLTRDGDTVERYSTFFDDDAEMPYGLGCGGTVWLLTQRGDNANRALAALERGVRENAAVTFLHQLSGERVGTHAAMLGEEYLWTDALPSEEEILCVTAFRLRENQWHSGTDELFVEYMPPPQRLFCFGAGDDAQPVVRLGTSLGWSVVVADGRANLATQPRFPQAAQVHVLARNGSDLTDFQFSGDDAVVVMTHSYAQDCRLLPALLHAPVVPGYIGVLGPRSRTIRLLQVSGCPPDLLARLHAPVGLNLGSHSPAEIALSIVAEIQAAVRGKHASAAAAA